MKIVFQHDHILPVKTYGGIERIMFWHMCELVKQGHQVTLIGHPESEVSSFGIELIPMSDKEWEHLIPNDTDIIHLQYNHEVKNNIPTINTIHGNGKIGETFKVNSVFVGKRHGEIHGSSSYIHNAIDLVEYPYRPKETNNWQDFLFLAKASWSVKNLKHCLKACKKAKKHLNIVGGKAILPSRYVTSHGFVGGERKLDIIRQCDAMLFPVRWEEPFGIAMIEAMSQGIPVIGSKYGSLPELISQEVGHTCASYNDFFDCINEPQQFDKDKIRKYVEENFSISTYTEKYVEAYKKVINGEKLNSSAPQFKGSEKAETLKPF